jgi:glycosyltransferase involved in cell wall biosynthesis
MHCIIVGTAYPLRGGIAHYNALLAEALARHHTVETVTFSRQYPAFLFPGKTQQETGEGPHGSPAPQLVDSINPFNWISVGRTLRRRRPDVLIFKYWLPFFAPCFGTIARIVRRGTNTKVILICDNVLPHERRPFDAAFTRYLFRCVNAFIVQSNAVEKELRAFWPRALYRNVPHPVYNIFGLPVSREVARQRLQLGGSRIILFFGYVRRYKGLGVLLEALSLVGRSMEVQLLVVGEFYDDEQKYRDLVKKLRLEDHVLIHSDYLPNEQVGAYFSAADAVVLPYLSATQSGIAQIAFNFEKPVIATDVGGLAEVVRDGITGIIVRPNDATALAEGVLRFYRDAPYDLLIQNIREEKKKYSWENLAAAIEELASDQ